MDRFRYLVSVTDNKGTTLSSYCASMLQAPSSSFFRALQCVQYQNKMLREAQLHAVALQLYLEQKQHSQANDDVLFTKYLLLYACLGSLCIMQRSM